MRDEWQIKTEIKIERRSIWSYFSRSEKAMIIGFYVALIGVMVWVWSWK